MVNRTFCDGLAESRRQPQCSSSQRVERQAQAESELVRQRLECELPFRRCPQVHLEKQILFH